MIPELVLNGVYEVRGLTDGWNGICEVVIADSGGEFYINPIDDMPRAFASRRVTNGFVPVSVNSLFHKAMKLIENPLEDIKINISINDLL